MSICTIKCGNPSEREKKIVLKTLLNIFKSYICLFLLFPFSFPFFFIVPIGFCHSFCFTYIKGFHLFLHSIFSHIFPLFINKKKTHLKHDDDFSIRACSHFVGNSYNTRFHFYRFHFSSCVFLYAVFRSAFIWIMKAIDGNSRVRQSYKTENQKNIAIVLKLGKCRFDNI